MSVHMTVNGKPFGHDYNPRSIPAVQKPWRQRALEAEAALAALSQPVAEAVEVCPACWHHFRPDNTAMVDNMAKLEDAGLLLFVAEVMEEWNAGDLDGGTRQDLAEKHGLLIPQEVSEPCGEDCECAAYGEFPQTCYWPSPLLIRCRHALASSGLRGGEHDG